MYNNPGPLRSSTTHKNIEVVKKNVELLLDKILWSMLYGLVYTMQFSGCFRYEKYRNGICSEIPQEPLNEHRYGVVK